MSITHHPAEELLVAYATGATEEAVSLVVATHLTLCPKCRATVADAEAACGMLFEELAPQPLGERGLQSVLSRLDARVDRPAPPAPSADWGVPEPLRSYLSQPLAQTRWIPAAPGLSFRNVLSRGKTRARLIRSAPGRGVDLHTHRGEEFTLVLAGGYTDELGTYQVGDLQTATPETLHTPTADDEGYCINFAVTTAPMRFRAWPAGLVAKIFGF